MCLLPPPPPGAALVQEVRNLAILHHTHIVQFLGYSLHDDVVRNGSKHNILARLERRQQRPRTAARPVPGSAEGGDGGDGGGASGLRSVAAWRERVQQHYNHDDHLDDSLVLDIVMELLSKQNLFDLIGSPTPMFTIAVCLGGSG